MNQKSDSMTKFLLIRHATTDFVGNTLSGRMPGVSLNHEGRLQAEKLADRLSGLPLAAVYSSPLQRAVETALPICKVLNLEHQTTDDFMEIDFGEWTGLSFQNLEQQSRFRLFNTFRSNTRIRGGELMLEAQLRMITGLEKLRARHRNETIAVVGHSDLIKAAVAYYAGIHLDMFQRIEISPASISIIEIYDETARILVVNDTGGIKV
jgi:probable phosphoglycerate mutase